MNLVQDVAKGVPRSLQRKHFKGSEGLGKVNTMSKPVWIICNQEWADDILYKLASSSSCPVPYKGKICPKDDNGDLLGCEKCWQSLIEFVDADKEGE